MRPSSLTDGLASVARASGVELMSAVALDTATVADAAADADAVGALVGGAIELDAYGKICDSSSLRCCTRTVRSWMIWACGDSGREVQFSSAIPTDSNSVRKGFSSIDNLFVLSDDISSYRGVLLDRQPQIRVLNVVLISNFGVGLEQVND
jgi:hypothetical protein